jgi:hypothetical protein
VRSVSPRTLIRRACLLAGCGLLLVTSPTGCTTTQETAAHKQAESKRILEARERKHESKSHDQGGKQR